MPITKDKLRPALWFIHYRDADQFNKNPFLNEWNEKTFDETTIIPTDKHSMTPVILLGESLSTIVKKQDLGNYLRNPLLSYLITSLLQMDKFLSAGTQETKVRLNQQAKDLTLELRVVVLEIENVNSVRIQVVTDVLSIVNENYPRLTLLKNDQSSLATFDTLYKITYENNQAKIGVIEHYEIARHPELDKFLGWVKPPLYKQFFSSYREAHFPEKTNQNTTTANEIVKKLTGNGIAPVSSLKHSGIFKLIQDPKETKLIQHLLELVNSMIEEANKADPNYNNLNEIIRLYYKEKEQIEKDLEVQEMLGRNGVKPERFKVIESEIFKNLDFKEKKILNLFNAVSFTRNNFGTPLLINDGNQKFDTATEDFATKLFNSLADTAKKQGLIIIEKKHFEASPAKEKIIRFNTHKKTKRTSALDAFVVENFHEDLQLKTEEANNLLKNLNSPIAENNSSSQEPNATISLS